MNKRDVRMAALRAALVALMLAAMVATFLVLVLLLRRSLEGNAHAIHSGGADAISIDTDAAGNSANALGRL